MAQVICDKESCRHNVDGECDKWRITVGDNLECEDYDR